MANVGRGILVCAICMICMIDALPLCAVHPESPEVRVMVEKAAKHLEDSRDARLGGRALMAMALMKAGRGVDHPLVSEVVAELASLTKDSDGVDSVLDIYETAVCIVFLCDVDPQGHSAAVTELVQSLVRREKKPWGGWGYPEAVNGRESSDTSMTQYALLACWLADRSRAAKVPKAVVERACNWLIRTQDPTGQWGYQGIDPSSYNRVEQQEKRHSLCAAGLGSCYVCGNFLGLLDEKGIVFVDSGDLPSVLIPVIEETTSSAEARTTDKVDLRYLRRAIADGNQWFERYYRVDPEEYQLYYLYTYERYRSFQELSTGRAVAEPEWYNNGARYLKRTQAGDGSWNLNGNGAVIDTCFAVLFLKRSARQTIKKAMDAYDGLLSGGRGLPKSTDSLQVKDGQLVRTPFQGTADRLLAILEGEHAVELESVTEDSRIELSRDPNERARQLVRLRRLVRAEEAEIRAMSVRTLGESRDLDSIPVLIYALSDPDPQIARKAEKALRNVSRKLLGIGEFTDSKAAVAGWEKWYRLARPEQTDLPSPADR